MGESLKIRLAGQITQKDYVRAQLLHLRPRPAIAVVGVVIAVIAIGLAAWQVYRWSTGELAAAEAMGLPTAVVALMGYFAVLLPWRFRKSYRTARALHEPVEMELTDVGLLGRSQYGEARLPWKLFHRFKENQHLFVVYQSDALMHILPKRLLEAPDSVDAVREVLKREIRPAI